MPAAISGFLGRACPGLLATLLPAGCVFGPLEPGAPFTQGVYLADVRVDDGCQQIQVTPTPTLDCRGGLWTDPDANDALVAFWPELDGDTYVINDGAVPQVNSAPVLRWSTSDRILLEGCDSVDHRWVLALSNDDDGVINGSLRNTWTNVKSCPIGTGAPQADCTTQFTYRFELETACTEPCQLVDAETDPAEGEAYDCGASVCECP
jgi:hypothetical protein